MTFRSNEARQLQNWRSWSIYKWALPYYVFFWRRGRRLRLHAWRLLSIWLTSMKEKSLSHEVREVLLRFKPNRSPVELERVGAAHDGGYLVPKDLSGVKALFSPGVGDKVDFDLELASRGISVYLADKSVDLDVSGLSRVHFLKKHLGSIDSSDTITLGSWMKQSGYEPGSPHSFILQMDIEGAEWEVGRNLDPRELERFKVILVEVHELQRVFTKAGLGEVLSWIERLTSGHKIVNTHVNNGDLPVRHRGIAVPPLVELVFLRDDYFSAIEDELEIPHPLEAPNDPSFPQRASSFWLGGDEQKGLPHQSQVGERSKRLGVEL